MKTYDFGRPKGSRGPLSDEVFRQASGGFILVAVDVVLCNDGGIFLATRSIEPAKGLRWVFGGRVRPFEEFRDAACRHILADLDLTPTIERFVPLELAYPIRVCWPVRQQDPPNIGADYIVPQVFALRVSDDEVARAADNLNSAEYDRNSGIQFFTWRKTEDVYLNPYVRDLITCVQALAKRM